MELYLIGIVAIAWILHSTHRWNIKHTQSCKKLLWETGVPVKINNIYVTKSGKILAVNFLNLTDKQITGITFKFIGLNDESKIEDMILNSAFENNTLKPYLNKTIKLEVDNSNISEINQHFPIEVTFDDGSKWVINK